MGDECPICGEEYTRMVRFGQEKHEPVTAVIPRSDYVYCLRERKEYHGDERVVTYVYVHGEVE